MHTKNIYERNIRSPLTVSVVNALTCHNLLVGDESSFSFSFQHVTQYKYFSPYLKHEAFSCERRRRLAKLGGGGSGGMHPPGFFFKKKMVQFGAF